MLGLIEDIGASYLLLHSSYYEIFAWVEIYGESPTGYEVEKERSILIFFQIIMKILQWYYTKTQQVVASQKSAETRESKNIT